MLEQLDSKLSHMCYCQGFLVVLLFSWFSVWLIIQVTRLFKE